MFCPDNTQLTWCCVEIKHNLDAVSRWHAKILCPDDTQFARCGVDIIHNWQDVVSR